MTTTSKVNVSLGYTHYQRDESTEWIINHNKKIIPAVQVYVMKDEYEKRMLPKEIIIVDENTVKIQFSVPTVGRAVLL